MHKLLAIFTLQQVMRINLQKCILLLLILRAIRSGSIRYLEQYMAMLKSDTSTAYMLSLHGILVLTSAMSSSSAIENVAPGQWMVGKDRWEISKRYIVEEAIGRGAYGTVIRAQDTVTKRLVAIKRIESSALSNSTDALRILREVAILSRIKHR